MNKSFLFLVYLLSIFVISSKAQVPGSNIDVQHYTFTLQLSDADDVIKGQADISLKYLKDATSIKIDLVKKNAEGKGMLVSSVTEGGTNLQFVQSKDALTITTKASAGTAHKYTIAYEGIPADGLIISKNKFGHRTFFGDNWPNRAHYWLPCVDDPADKATVDFIVTAPDHYQVIANGAKLSETLLPNNLRMVHWKESAPLPMKVVVIGVAEFAIDHTGDVNGIPVYTYVFPDNKDQGFKSYAEAKEILAYYIEKVGPYAYEKLANVQSKTIYGGMENASAIFYFENSVSRESVEQLLAHEIAHQWFGDAASETDFSHVWLSEGFATYMTYVFIDHKYGVEKMKECFTKDRIKIFQFEKSRYTPIVDTSRANLVALLNANSYEKGAWVLHMLWRKLGDEAFWKGTRAYYAKYDGGNANTDDFRKVMEKASGQDLQQFFKQWLYTAGHPKLGINWKYDAAKKMVDIQVEQKQNTLYDLSLELEIDGKIYPIAIKNKTTSVQFPAKTKPASVVADPKVNLLGEFEVTAE
jgi:aminopeptidase N